MANYKIRISCGAIVARIKQQLRDEGTDLLFEKLKASSADGVYGDYVCYADSVALAKAILGHTNTRLIGVFDQHLMLTLV